MFASYELPLLKWCLDIHVHLRMTCNDFGHSSCFIKDHHQVKKESPTLVLCSQKYLFSHTKINNQYLKWIHFLQYQYSGMSCAL